jgi:mannose-6-phosphate isomerase-like protein (cupin superfamily)
MTDEDALAAVNAPRTTPPPNMLSDHTNYQEQLVSRNKTGGVEQHMDWNEYFIVQDGAATLNYGGTSVDAKEMRPGEFLGSSISNGSTIQIRKGDIVTLPAGTPHQIVLAPGASVRYLDFKGRKD